MSELLADTERILVRVVAFVADNAEEQDTETGIAADFLTVAVAVTTGETEAAASAAFFPAAVTEDSADTVAVPAITRSPTATTSDVADTVAVDLAPLALTTSATLAQETVTATAPAWVFVALNDDATETVATPTPLLRRVTAALLTVETLAVAKCAPRCWVVAEPVAETDIPARAPFRTPLTTVLLHAQETARRRPATSVACRLLTALRDAAYEDALRPFTVTELAQEALTVFLCAPVATIVADEVTETLACPVLLVLETAVGTHRRSGSASCV